MRLLIPLVLLAACRNDKASGTDTANGTVDTIVDADGDGYDTTVDCDDATSVINPGAEETCDGFDNDCDGEVDEGVTSTFYADGDGDGFGDPGAPTEACSEPTGYVGIGNDCDDDDPDSYPAAAERCDGEDNDCDGEVDEDVVTSWHADADADGYGDPGSVIDDCDPPDGYTADDTDCDDLNATAHPGAEEVCDGDDNDCDEAVDEDVTTTFYQDADSDGYGVADVTTEDCDLPTGYAARSGDCDDTDGTVSPNATELCDSVDNDCDGTTDEDDAADAATWYADRDRDGYGNASDADVSCAQPSGYVSDDDDCDDSTADANPGEAEVCDEIDNDCDGSTDEDDATDAATWYADNDGDGYGGTSTTAACEMPSGFADNSDDCDDGEAASNPGEAEVCDEVDNDCDGNVDEGVTTTYFLDYDGDSYGDGDRTTEACSAPSGYTSDDSDCDDGDEDVNPAASEVCNDVDDDCDGDVDSDDADGPAAQDWYPDEDEDGYGDPDGTVSSDCAQPSGYTDDDTDCDDSDEDVNPAASETCDGVDEDCDGTVDNDGDVLGDGEACPAEDCQDILDARSGASDGVYWIDPAGDGAFEALCDMTTDDGGWTMIASFNNDDGTYNWTKYAYNTDYLDNWTNETTFGDLDDYETEDYKSPAFWRVDATDLMAVDSGGNWASYDDSLSGSLADTLSGYTSCQTSLVTGVSIDSSDSTVATYGRITFYGADPNYSNTCAHSYATDGTDSSVIALAGTGCGTAGFGHLGYLASGSGHQDRDFLFCLDSSPSTSSTSSCGNWHGVNMVSWFSASACDYALLFVR